MRYRLDEQTVMLGVKRQRADCNPSVHAGPAVPENIIGVFAQLRIDNQWIHLFREQLLEPVGRAAVDQTVDQVVGVRRVPQLHGGRQW